MKLEKIVVSHHLDNMGGGEVARIYKFVWENTWIFSLRGTFYLRCI